MGKSPCLMAKSTISTGPCSIAMSNYQRVNQWLFVGCWEDQSIAKTQSLGTKKDSLPREGWKWRRDLDWVMVRIALTSLKTLLRLPKKRSVRIDVVAAIGFEMCRQDIIICSDPTTIPVILHHGTCGLLELRGESKGRRMGCELMWRTQMVSRGERMKKQQVENG